MAREQEPGGRHALESFIQRLRTHSDLSDPDAQAIRALPHKLVRLRQNAQPVREGDTTTACLVLVSGYVDRFRLTDEGERQILAIYVAGDPLDFDRLYLPVADDGLQATRESVVARIQHADLRDLLAERPLVAEAVMRAVLVDASIFREWTLNVGRRDARRRIAHLMCEIAVRLEVQGFDFQNTPLPFTQDQVADATGMTPVHVNRTLKALRAERCIDGRRGGFVVLTDIEALRMVGGFDARYLHLEPK